MPDFFQQHGDMPLHGGIGHALRQHLGRPFDDSQGIAHFMCNLARQFPECGHLADALDPFLHIGQLLQTIGQLGLDSPELDIGFGQRRGHRLVMDALIPFVFREEVDENAGHREVDHRRHGVLDILDPGD